jgi:hypothetical protein
MRFYDWAGGRKIAIGYVAALLLTAMAFLLKATYAEYAGGLLLALGITSGTIAYEDSRRPFGEA